LLSTEVTIEAPCDTSGHWKEKNRYNGKKSYFSRKKRTGRAVKLWIDADAAPADVKQIVFRAAKRLGVQTILVANRLLETPRGLPMVRSIQVRDGADEADRFIVAHGQPGDLVITADLPLAGLLVDKGLFVIDPRGAEYSPDTIATRLSMRNFMDELRGEGMVLSGTAPYGDADKKAFASTFDRLLTKALRRSQAAQQMTEPKLTDPKPSDS
jgi:uncharacterized protein YaiI (UPF0178 family)